MLWCFWVYFFYFVPPRPKFNNVSSLSDHLFTYLLDYVTVTPSYKNRFVVHCTVHCFWAMSHARDPVIPDLERHLAVW